MPVGRNMSFELCKCDFVEFVVDRNESVKIRDLTKVIHSKVQRPDHRVISEKILSCAD